jgi:lysozyme
MPRKTNNRAGGRGRGSVRNRILAALLLLALIGGAWAWWHLHHWTPARGEFGVQGVEIGSGDGAVSFASLKAIGADFAYVDASVSAFARDPLFVANFEKARAAGLQVGAVHRYDPCQPADRQAANFVTTVPRDAALLPPAVELDMLADACPFNQVETHTGKPTVLKITKAFEARYGVARKLDRNLWLVEDRMQPDYAGRPWTLWTANTALANEVSDTGLRWVVVQR